VARLLLDWRVDNDGGSLKITVKGAAEGGHEQLVQLLLDRGAVVTSDVLKMGAGSGNDKVVRLLLDRGAEIDGNAIEAAIEAAAERGYQTTIEDHISQLEGWRRVQKCRQPVKGCERVVKLLFDRSHGIDTKRVLQAISEHVHENLRESPFIFPHSRGKEEREAALQAAISSGLRWRNEKIMPLLQKHSVNSSDQGNAEGTG
jgi:hypothetical protein